ncbi:MULTISPECIES: CHAT domain-containing tetratricopeptide repeat protein [Nostocaceae]|uniref:CHAT domain-containing protein n=1 Tax=Nostocaceae TaxID=1162 RepID=UPI0028C503AB|nr:CHAT domain-containing tetratricopeptide repeat protein [Anabaena sp. FACHB-83]
MDEQVRNPLEEKFSIITNSLGVLYTRTGKFKEAISLYQDSLSKIRGKLGENYIGVAIISNNLAQVYHMQGNYADAEKLYQKSLSILGNNHLYSAKLFNNIGELYRVQKKYKKAEEFYKKSLVKYKEVYGNNHPETAFIINNIGLLYYSKGDYKLATEYFSQGLEIEQKNLTQNLVAGSESQKLDYINTVLGTTYTTISLHLQSSPNDSKTARLALTTTLRRKGKVLDAVADSIQILRSQLERNPESQKLFDEWLTIQKQLSALVFQELERQAPEQYKVKIEQLEKERQRLEAAISEKSAEFRQEIQPVQLAAIQAKIPQNGALVEFVQYQPLNAKAKKESEKWGNLRYAAVVLHSKGEPKWVDLGEVAIINESARNLQAGLRKPEFLRQVQKASRQLDEQLMKPIRPLLGNTRHILLSLDGQLTLLPFEALVDEQGQYLIQRYAFSYLTTGRDLLRFKSPATSRSSPVVLADIDYGRVQTVKAIAKSTGSSQNLRSNDFVNNLFYPLAATKAEAVAIKDILPNAKVFLGKDATETAVKQLQAPSILHLATHGFFLSDQEINLSPSLGSSIRQPSPQILKLENPLLRSGLALANINIRNKLPTNSDDGVLTALEVAGLNLRGTQLVVMSACDTGKGDVKVGEGVYGLRRALVIAGSQSQVLSLWKVSDEATKELMVKYYSKLKAGKGRHEALREAQLEILESQDYKHPFFWAAFVPSGDWNPLHMD